MTTRKICLALQGGGAHGAFTWGVLDRLLEEPSLEIEAVSGTSAGAMNAAILVDALKREGAQHARKRLARFWRTVAEAGGAVFKPGRRAATMLGPSADWSPLALWTDMVSLVWSPYDNPFYANALAEILESELPDTSALNDHRTPYLFVCATDVQTNCRKIFRAGELSVPALAASACLPTLFRSVQVGADYYWDGGYMGNPALNPLRSPALSADLLIVWVNPLQRPGVPTNAREILGRLNEITFNASVVQEIEAIDAVNELKAGRDGAALPYKRIRLHEIADEAHMSLLGHATKTTVDWSFLLQLHRWGRDAASRWLATSFADVGKKATADMSRILGCLQS